MTAYILIVEDDDEFSTALTTIINGKPGLAQIVVAKGRDTAQAAIDGQFFDLAILDLKIPTIEGGLDSQPDHGKFIFQYLRKFSPGTKVLVLTGSPSDDFIADLLGQKHDADIWGEGQAVGTVEFLRKIDLDQAPEKIGKIKSAIIALDDVELTPDRVNLQIEEDRLLRIFAKRFGAARCTVSPIGEGLSGAKPYRLHLFDEQGMPLNPVFAKLGPIEKVLDESTRYDQHVVLLDANSTPRKMALLEYGAGKSGGAFFQLAEGFDESIYSVLGSGPERAARLVEVVKACLDRWAMGNAQLPRTIGEVRRCWVNDEKAAELQGKFNLDWAAELESRRIQTRWRRVHGDLHGGNILVSAADSAVLIDYGDVQHCAISFDAVTLELSAVLQQNPALSDNWPTDAQCRLWHDIDRYVAGSPIAEFVRACRSWAEGHGAGRREVGACAYAYLLRQLKYDDTNKVRIVALMEGVREYIAAT